MANSRLKTALIYAALGAAAGTIVLLWRIRQTMDLLPVEPMVTNAFRANILNEPPRRLRPSPSATTAELIRTVQAQLDAFRAGDYSKAFSFAARELQAGFTVPVFEQMVKRDYPMIARWKSARFGTSFSNETEAVVQAFIAGEDGLETEFEYRFTRENDGWRITGVRGRPDEPPAPVGRL